MNLRILPIVILWALTAGSAIAQDVPSRTTQEILIKTSLLTFNDAIVTGNFAVMHARLAKPFRDQYSPARLKQVFQPFIDQKAHFGMVAAMTPVATTEAKVEASKLMLRGYFDTKPNRVAYELDYVPSEGEWKLYNIRVKAAPAGE